MASEWEVELDGRIIGTRSSKQAAMNHVDRPYRKGKATVRSKRDGEAWNRRGGSWYPADTHVAGGKKAAAAR